MELNCTTSNNYNFKVIKQEDDPLCLRLSIGGDKNHGCYIVYRGNTEECTKLLENALEAMKKANTRNFTQNN